MVHIVMLWAILYVLGVVYIEESICYHSVMCSFLQKVFEKIFLAIQSLDSAKTMTSLDGKIQPTLSVVTTLHTCAIDIENIERSIPPPTLINCLDL